MKLDKELCGCASDESRWVILCPTHKAERTAREHELYLDSLHWLMNYYDRRPNEDNLEQVIIRLREAGARVRLRAVLVSWVNQHRTEILAYTTKRRRTSE